MELTRNIFFCNFFSARQDYTASEGLARNQFQVVSEKATTLMVTTFASFAPRVCLELFLSVKAMANAKDLATMTMM